MTPQALADLHAASLTVPRPWSASEFASFLASPQVFCLTRGQDGLLLGRVILDEAELLTLAVAPQSRRQGLGRALVQDFLETARARGAKTAFLEVAAPNQAALALYLAMGFTQTGRRRGYYSAPGGAQDALILGCPL